jgi:hypothetical protein
MGGDVGGIMAAKREMPLGGRRAKMGTGRARGKMLGVMLDDARFERIAQLADAEGVTRTALVERWIDEHTPAVEPPDAPSTDTVGFKAVDP